MAQPRTPATVAAIMVVVNSRPPTQEVAATTLRLRPLPVVATTTMAETPVASPRRVASSLAPAMEVPSPPTPPAMEAAPLAAATMLATVLRRRVAASLATRPSSELLPCLLCMY